jgi:hypothetical protein
VIPGKTYDVMQLGAVDDSSTGNIASVSASNQIVIADVDEQAFWKVAMP